MNQKELNKITYVFIDASNLFYGGEKSLGWKIDYQKLLHYLKKKYLMSNALYFGGIEIYNKEIKQFAGNNFRDFEYLKYLLKMEKNK